MCEHKNERLKALRGRSWSASTLCSGPLEYAASCVAAPQSCAPRHSAFHRAVPQKKQQKKKLLPQKISGVDAPGSSWRARRPFSFPSVSSNRIRDPMYKKVGRDGRVYIDKALADKEILIIPVEAIPEDKIDFIEMGRASR